MNKENLDQKVLNWIKQAKEIAPEICDWIGVYYKASFYLNEDSTDLVLGPFIGASTEHTRIPLNRGICGLALKEEQTFNIPDVKSHSEYISCSLETKSELVIPLKNNEGDFIAELDIDSHTADAFSDEITKRFEAFCFKFASECL